MKILPRFTMEDDDLDLLWQFTAWMEQVVTHAATDYLRRQRYLKSEVSFEQSSLDALSYETPLPANKSDFDFAESKLANAFSNLNLLRRQILKLTFVDGLLAREAAERLNCSVDYVYLQKYRALKALRDQLMGGDKNGE